MDTGNELSCANPADIVRRCASKGCAKSFQGKMPPGWERLTPDSKLGERYAATRHHTVLCPQHAFDAGR